MWLLLFVCLVCACVHGPAGTIPRAGIFIRDFCRPSLKSLSMKTRRRNIRKMQPSEATQSFASIVREGRLCHPTPRGGIAIIHRDDIKVEILRTELSLFKTCELLLVTLA